MADTNEELFLLRAKIARIGESDCLKWWDSHALSEVGTFAVPRVFRRTARLSAAHMAIGAARAKHDERVPREPLVHLFNLGELLEGDFERWLIERKASSWEPPASARIVSAVSVTSAFQAIDVPLAATQPETREPAVSIGTVSSATLANGSRRLKLARDLAEAYGSSDQGRLVVPFVRVET